MEQVIYKIINLVNNKFYVGSTINQKVRFRQHRKLLRGSRHHCKHLQAAWNKYGEDKFLFAILEIVPETLRLQDVEQKYLTIHVGQDNCYNSGYSADAPWRNAPAHTTPNFGRRMAQGQKAAISTTLKAFYAEDYANHPRVGTLHTEETKAKISAAKLANPQTPWLGKERSEATKQKISETQQGVKKAPRTFTPEGLERARANMKRNAVAHEPKGLESVLAKFPAEVLVAYDFSNAVYTGALSRITGVFCEQHGIFSNYAARFRKGSGCPECGEVRRAASKKVQMLEAWANDDQRTEMLAARKKVAPTKE
jgi:group I intron endonuclease